MARLNVYTMDVLFIYALFIFVDGVFFLNTSHVLCFFQSFHQSMMTKSSPKEFMCQTHSKARYGSNKTRKKKHIHINRQTDCFFISQKTFGIDFSPIQHHDIEKSIYRTSDQVCGTFIYTIGISNMRSLQIILIAIIIIIIVYRRIAWVK